MLCGRPWPGVCHPADPYHSPQCCYCIPLPQVCRLGSGASEEELPKGSAERLPGCFSLSAGAPLLKPLT